MRLGLGQVDDRAYQSGGGSGGADQGCDGAPPQDPPAHDQGRDTQRSGRSGRDALLRQYRKASLATRERSSSPCRRECIRLRWQQLPLRGGRVRVAGNPCRLGRPGSDLRLLRRQPRGPGVETDGTSMQDRSGRRSGGGRPKRGKASMRRTRSGCSWWPSGTGSPRQTSSPWR